MPRVGAATRERILSAAERLFAERGLGRVSLNEINAAARQRNTSAVHYHFKSREQLVQAVLDRHVGQIDERRRGLLEELDRAGDADLAALVRVLVEPLAEKLDHRSGRAFLCIQAELAPQVARPLPATRGLTERVGRHLAAELPEPVARVRGDLAQLLLFPALAERARREDGRRASREDRGLFVEELVDALVGVLAAPVSERTRRLLSAGAAQPARRSAR